MGGKIIFVVGLAAGYVLGAKAGRERYTQIATAANRLWANPTVKRTVDKAEVFVKDHAPDVADLAAEGTRRVVSAATGRKSRSSGSRAAASDTSS
ncbi:MAG: YtxH domain-containing protein [Micrococcales bacterium]|nr:YtxH domain-containing protein [Micrococcales bacterium]